MMKKYVLGLALISVLMLGLTGCLSVPKEEVAPADTTPVVEDPPVVEEEEKSETAMLVEDFENYADSDIPTLIECPPTSTEALAFIETAVEDGIKELKLMDTEGYKMTLYLTANPEKVNTKEFKKVINEGFCIEAGTNNPLKAYDDNLLWGFQMCSTGVAIAEDQPGYEDFQKCLKVQDDLRLYLDAVVAEEYVCPEEEGANIDCELGDLDRARYCEWAQENCEDVVFAL